MRWRECPRILGRGSSIGGIYTDYEFAGSSNRIGGVDFTARFNDKWTAQGQAVESSTKHLDGSYAAGPASYLEFTRNGHSFNFDNTYKDYSSGFQSQVGFIQTTDFRNNQTHATYQWYPKHSVLQSIGLETNDNFAFDHQGNRLYHYTTVDPLFPAGAQYDDCASGRGELGYARAAGWVCAGGES